ARSMRRSMMLRQPALRATLPTVCADPPVCPSVAAYVSETAARLTRSCQAQKLDVARQALDLAIGLHASKRSVQYFVREAEVRGEFLERSRQRHRAAVLLCIDCE